MDVAIVSQDVADTESGAIPLSFVFAPGIGIVHGFDALVQACLVNLLTNIGTRAYSRASGSDLLLVANAYGQDSLDRFAASAQAGIRKVETDMLAEQDNYALPPERRLAFLRLSSVEYSNEDGEETLIVSIQVGNEAGQVQDFTV